MDGENYSNIYFKISMMIWKTNLNLFWLAFVIYLINSVEIWLFCEEKIIIEIWAMKKAF
jgi:hypothetical protein